MSGSLMILGCFVLGVLLARLGWIPDYFLEHDGTLYVLYALMFLVGISIGHDRRLGEILRTLRPRVLLLPLATTVGTFAGAALASITLAYSLSECLAVGSGLAEYSLSSIFITQYKGAELGTVALLANIMRELATLLFTPLMVRWISPLAALVRRRVHHGFHPAGHHPLRGQAVGVRFHRARHDPGFQRAFLGDLLLYPVTQGAASWPVCVPSNSN